MKKTLLLLLIMIIVCINYIKKDKNTTRNLPYYNNGVFMTTAKSLDHELYKYKDNKEKWSIFAIIGKSKNAPQKQLPTIKPEFGEKPSDFAIYWLGHSTTIIELDNKRILIDPVFGNAAPVPFVVCRYNKAVIKRNELPKLDYVLITHNHYDHLEKKTVKYLKNNKFIVPLGVKDILVNWGIKKENIVELAWNEDFKDDSIYIKALTGIHFSGRTLNDSNKTLWNSYIIQGKNKKIFWSGDTGYGTQFKEFGEIINIQGKTKGDVARIIREKMTDNEHPTSVLIAEIDTLANADFLVGQLYNLIDDSNVAFSIISGYKDGARVKEFPVPPVVNPSWKVVGPNVVDQLSVEKPMMFVEASKNLTRVDKVTAFDEEDIEKNFCMGCLPICQYFRQYSYYTGSSWKYGA